eukprot:CAMPEP_0194282578 /NCGR_PEP_ID=MMETSP0169-20130528/23432_1 /TAXON_ID=218684 /ORGANISM="Corethron pennatum, Strain L29A3" /LENGTH=177 /DNA_ID=CAMNT_0039027943 /DNA_START=24 /DNA_END=553 /DNA_ORIENTATION=+
MRKVSSASCLRSPRYSVENDSRRASISSIPASSQIKDSTGMRRVSSGGYLSSRPQSPCASPLSSEGDSPTSRMGISMFTTDNMRLYAPGRYHSIAEIMLNAREVRILDEEDGSDAEAAGDGDDCSADCTADADGSDTELSGSTDVASRATPRIEYNVAYLAWDTVPDLPSALRDCRG